MRLTRPLRPISSAAPGRRATPAGRARPPTGPKRLPQTLLDAIETDPAFLVVTDDFQWIDPFSGEAVPAQHGRVEAARAYLLETGVWQFSNPLTKPELDIIRWRFDLVPRLRAEPRLRLFTRDGMWVNPYTGELVANIRREEGRITNKTILDLARILAACPQASTGLMLDLDTLRQCVREASGGHPTAPGATPSRTSQSPPPTPDSIRVVRTVPQRMLASLPSVAGFDLAVHYAPAAATGGDFYDCIELHSNLRLFLLGEVSGHGVEAALVVASALATLHLLARGGGNTVDLLSRFNDEVRRDLAPGQFITLFVAELDPAHKNLTCFCAGHHPALLFNPAAESLIHRIGQPGMAIGLTDSDAFRSSLAPTKVTLEPGDTLMQSTSGIANIRNEQGVPIGELRLCAEALLHLDNTPQALVDGLAEVAVRYAGRPLSDDVTLFALRCADEQTGEGGENEWAWPLHH